MIKLDEFMLKAISKAAKLDTKITLVDQGNLKSGVDYCILSYNIQLMDFYISVGSNSYQNTINEYIAAKIKRDMAEFEMLKQRKISKDHKAYVREAVMRKYANKNERRVNRYDSDIISLVISSAFEEAEQDGKSMTFEQIYKEVLRDFKDRYKYNEEKEEQRKREYALDEAYDEQATWPGPF